jgi:hypothetical protein
MDFKETECEAMDWIQMARDRILWWAVVSTAMNIWFPLRSEHI